MFRQSENKLISEIYGSIYNSQSVIESGSDEIKAGSFLITPNGKLVDVRNYESHGIGILAKIDGMEIDDEDEDSSFEEGEARSNEFRAEGGATGWINPGSDLNLTLVSLDCVKNAKKELFLLVNKYHIKNINIDVVDSEGSPVRSISRDVEWLERI